MPADLIRFMCPKLRCRAILAAPISARGEDVRCPHCATRIKVPGNKAKSDNGIDEVTIVKPIE